MQITHNVANQTVYVTVRCHGEVDTCELPGNVDLRSLQQGYAFVGRAEKVRTM